VDLPERKGNMVFSLETEEKIDSQCPHDIAVIPFEVAVGTGFR
jgi:hypothetical protein